MSVEFIAKAKKDNLVPPKKTFILEIDRLYLTVRTTGLSAPRLATILGALKKLNFDDDIFKKLVACLIPNENIPDALFHKIMTWIFTIYGEKEESTFESLLIWIASLLDFDLIGDCIDEYYGLIHCLLEYFPKPVSHILYKLTKSHDVTLKRIEEIRRILLKYEREPCLCALLNRYKELNSTFSYVTVPSYKKCEKVFSYDDDFYLNLQAALRNTANTSSSIIAHSIVVPAKKEKTAFKEDLLPKAHYLPAEVVNQNSEYYIDNIKSGTQLMKNFYKLVLPSHTLSLMKNDIGIFVLMTSSRSIQENFLRNLAAVLDRSFISNPISVSKEEKENLLNNLILVHILFQQGFTYVSKFLSTYLLFWDGVAFKNQIYLLLEWFVFQSEKELNRYVLKPLFLLFISGDDVEMCDILICLTNLITNLFCLIEKEKRRISNIYEEKILHNRNKLVPVLQKLSKFIAHLCKLGLYIHPCNHKILKTAIEFYRKINDLEDEEIMDRSIISSSVLYHSLLCFNGQILNEVCSLMPSYRDQMLIGEASPIMNSRFNRLMGYVGDLINFLWTSKAFTNRMKGRIFYSVPVEHSVVWHNYANLNNGLDILKHIMFEPQRSLAVLENNLPNRQFVSKDEVLKILAKDFPHIVEFIETVLQNAQNSRDDEKL